MSLPDWYRYDEVYFADVKALVVSAVGAELVSVSDSAELVGRWLHSFHLNGPFGESTVYEYFDDGTFVSGYDEPGSPRSKWRLESDSYFEIVWCDPGVGIPDGAWDEAEYHCARTSDGSVILWNADGSVVRVLSPEATSTRIDA